MAALTAAAEALELGLTLAEFYELQAAERAAITVEAELETGGGGLVSAGVSSAFGIAGLGFFASRLTRRRKARPVSEDILNRVSVKRDRSFPQLGHIQPLNVRRYSPVSETPLLGVTNPSGFAKAKMPYVRRSAGAKRAYAPKRKRVTKKRTARASTQKIKRVIYSTAEKKYIDTMVTMVDPAITWAGQLIGPVIPQGTGVGNRTGNRVSIRYCEMSFETKQASASTTFPGAQLRCIIVLAKENQNSITVPSASDLFVDLTTVASVRVREKMSDYQMLADWTTIIPAGNAAPLSMRRTWKVGKTFIYNNTLSTAADMPGYCMYMYCCSTAAAGNLTCAGRIRTHFVDN